MEWIRFVMEETVSKELEFDVKMDAKILYDFLVFHEYSKAVTIMASCIGALAILVGLNYGYVIYIIAGAVIILYTPVNLKFVAARNMLANVAYKKPLHYVVDSEGICVMQDDTEQKITWDKCTKAASTRRSIIVYTGKVNACVFPRTQLGDNLSGLIGVLASNMEPGRVKIRF